MAGMARSEARTATERTPALRATQNTNPRSGDHCGCPFHFPEGPANAGRCMARCTTADPSPLVPLRLLYPSHESARYVPWTCGCLRPSQSNAFSFTTPPQTRDATTLGTDPPAAGDCALVALAMRALPQRVRRIRVGA